MVMLEIFFKMMKEYESLGKVYKQAYKDFEEEQGGNKCKRWW
jgi:hypothetical protein